MPKYGYEYRCPDCDYSTIEYKEIDDRNECPTCPKCNIKMTRIIGKTNFVGTKGKGNWGKL